MDPMEAINREEITVKFNGIEAELVMRLFALAASLNIFNPTEKDIAISILDKFEPGIAAQAAKQIRLERDRFN